MFCVLPLMPFFFFFYKTVLTKWHQRHIHIFARGYLIILPSDAIYGKQIQEDSVKCKYNGHKTTNIIILSIRGALSTPDHHLPQDGANFDCNFHPPPKFKTLKILKCNSKILLHQENRSEG